MFQEIADIYIRDGEQEAFEKAITFALQTITAKAQGVRGYSLHKGVESPERYVLTVSWNTVEDHMITYMKTPEREVLRSLLAPFFAKPPHMQHFTLVVTG